MPSFKKLSKRKESKLTQEEESTEGNNSWSSWIWIILIILAIVIMIIIAVCIYYYMSPDEISQTSGESSSVCDKDIYDTLIDENIISCDYDTSGSFDD